MNDHWWKHVSWKLITLATASYVVMLVLTFREVSGAWWQ
jgi:hypothetical protein